MMVNPTEKNGCYTNHEIPGPRPAASSHKEPDSPSGTLYCIVVVKHSNWDKVISTTTTLYKCRAGEDQTRCTQ